MSERCESKCVCVCVWEREKRLVGEKERKGEGVCVHVGRRARACENES